MKKTLLAIILTLAWPVFAGVVDDAIQLEKAGLSNEVLLAWARQQKGYTISINDMLQLNLNNVPGNVIAVLIRNASAVIGSAAAEQPQPVAPVAPQIVYEDVPSYYPEYISPLFYPDYYYPYCYGYPGFGLNFGFGVDFGSFFGFDHHHHHHHFFRDNAGVVHSGRISAASHAVTSTRATSARSLTANSSSRAESARPNTMQRASTERSYSYSTPRSYSHNYSYSAPSSYSHSYSYSASRGYSGYSGGGYHSYSGGGYHGGGFGGGGHGGGGHR